MRRHHRIALGGLLIAILMPAAPAPAQGPERKVIVRPSDERKALLDEMPTRPIDTTAVLPPAELVTGRGLATVARIHLTRVALEGGTILTKAEVQKMAAPYEGREVTIEDLQDLRRQLSEEYVRRGYVTSGVILPDQEVVDGVVVLREVAGRLAAVHVTGNGRLDEGYVRNRIEGAAETPLRVQNLQEALELLQQDPLIRRINARLTPGLRPGESELTVALQRVPAFQVVVGADNLRSASTGGEQGNVSVAHLDLTGHGDAVQLDAGSSGGRTIGGLSYSYPLTSRNARILASISLDDARITEEPFKAIDIRSKTDRGALYFSQPILRRPSQALVASVGLERKHSESTLLGIPFSFSPGDRDGKSDTTVVNVGVEWTRRGRDQVFAFRGSVRRGLHAFGSTINEEGPDGRFTAFLGQAQFGRRGPRQSEVLVRATTQLAGGPLLGLEKMPIGGMYTVRGYRENQYVRDDGAAASVEWRIPVRAEGAREARFDRWNLRVAPFVDVGRSWDKEAQMFTVRAVNIASAGVGLLWNPMEGLRADLYWGHPFKQVRNTGTDLQDKGVHFSASYRVPLTW